MEITIRQPAGLGDIFFCQKIAVKLIQHRHTVYWPVIPEYQYIEQHIRNGIIWREPPHKTFELDLGNATRLVDWTNRGDWRQNLMEAKYMYANQHFKVGGNKTWWQYFKIDYRDYDAEKALCDMLITEEHKDGFCLFNQHFATQCYKIRKLKFESDLPMIEVEKYPEFNLFAWCGMVEKAKEIRIPDSSLPYIVEILRTTDRLYLYNRDGERNIRTKKLWHKPWTFVE